MVAVHEIQIPKKFLEAQQKQCLKLNACENVLPHDVVHVVRMTVCSH